MAYYDDDIQTADEMIREFGKDIQLKRITPSDNPDEPWESGEESEVVSTVPAVFLNFTSRDLATFRDRADMPELKVSDRKVLIPGMYAEKITSDDVLIDENGQWEVLFCLDLSPNGQKILYTLGVRQ